MRLGTFLSGPTTRRAWWMSVHAAANDGPAGQRQGPKSDFYHWSALRSVSGFEVYRKVYRDVIRPTAWPSSPHSAPDMPRPARQPERRGGQPGSWWQQPNSENPMRRAGKLRAELQFGRIDEILATGLHAYLTQFLDRVNDLGAHQPRVPGTGVCMRARPVRNCKRKPITRQ